MTLPWSYLWCRNRSDATYEKERQRKRERTARSRLVLSASRHWLSASSPFSCTQHTLSHLPRSVFMYPVSQACHSQKTVQKEGNVRVRQEIPTRNSTSAPQFLIRKYLFFVLGSSKLLFSLCAEYCVRSFEYHYVFCNSSSGPTCHNHGVPASARRIRT